MHSSIKQILKDLNLNPCKKWGQNFLIDDNYKTRIVNCLNISKQDSILEIGPGLGALTNIILQYSKKLLCVEIDKKITFFLKKIFGDSFLIINEDFLKLDFDNLCYEYKLNKVISNLPYSVSAKIILKIIAQKKIQLSILMIQKELCSRIIAKPKTKLYNNFSVLAQTFCNIKKEFDIPNTCFFPKPAVNSSVIRITPKINNNKISFKQMNFFLKICFQQKRKTLFNNLKTKFDPDLIKNFLNELNYNLNVRAEDITVEDYSKMFLFLNGKEHA